MYGWFDMKLNNTYILHVAKKSFWEKLRLWSCRAHSYIHSSYIHTVVLNYITYQSYLVSVSVVVT